MPFISVLVNLDNYPLANTARQRSRVHVQLSSTHATKSPSIALHSNFSELDRSLRIWTSCRIQVWDFSLSPEEMARMAALERGVRYNTFEHAAKHQHFPFHEEYWILSASVRILRAIDI